MKISELIKITVDDICIYREKRDTKDALNIKYEDLYKGEIQNTPIELLAKDIRLVGAKRKGVLDIAIEYEPEYIKITKEEAKDFYCKGKNVFVITNERVYWRLPKSSEYGSHAPIEELFYMSIPYGEGEVRFFVEQEV